MRRVPRPRRRAQMGRDVRHLLDDSTQDALTGSSYAYKKFGKNYMTLAQDYSFGHNQVGAWKSHLDALGASDMGDVFFPLTATDFTPYIQQILAKKPTSEIRRAARDEGMRFLRESALDKVRLGMTTLKEINKVTFIEAMR